MADSITNSSGTKINISNNFDASKSYSSKIEYNNQDLNTPNGMENNTEEYDFSLGVNNGVIQKFDNAEEWSKYFESTINNLNDKKKELDDLLDISDNSKYFQEKYPLLQSTIKDEGSILGLINAIVSPNKVFRTPEDIQKTFEETGGVIPLDWIQNGYTMDDYIKQYNDFFMEKTGMTYDEYKMQVNTINEEILSLKSSKYAIDQQIKENSYLEIVETEEYLQFAENNKSNIEEQILKIIGPVLEERGVNALSGGDGTSSNYRISTYYKYLTDEEKIMYCYLYQKEGRTKAESYLEAIEDRLNQLKGMDEAQKFIDSIRDENGNIDVNALNTALAAGKGILDGIKNFGEGLTNVFNDEGMISSSQYAQMYILQMLSGSANAYVSDIYNTIIETKGEAEAQIFKENIMNEQYEINLEYAKSVLTEEEYNNLLAKIDSDNSVWLSGAYELGTSFGNMLPSMAISLVLSSVATPAVVASIVGNTLMGLSAAGNSYNQALTEGNSSWQSRVYGALSGVSETTLGMLLGNIPGLNEASKLSIIGLFKEGGEEYLQEYVDAGLRATVLGETIDLDQLSKDAQKSFIYGVIMSGVTNGGKLGFDFVSQGKNIHFNSVNDVVSFFNILNNEGINITKDNSGNKVVVVNEKVSQNSETIESIKSFFPDASIVTNTKEGPRLITNDKKTIEETPVEVSQNISDTKSKTSISETTQESSVKYYIDSDAYNNVVRKLQSEGVYFKTALDEYLGKELTESDIKAMNEKIAPIDMNGDLLSSILKSNSSSSINASSINADLTTIINGHDKKWGDGSAIKQLTAFSDPNSDRYGDYNLISSSGDAREILKKYTPEQIATSLETYRSKIINSPLKYSGNIKTDIESIIKGHDSKYGEGDALKRLIAFSNPEHIQYGQYDLISRNNRDILSHYSPEQIRTALLELGYLDTPISNNTSANTLDFDSKQQLKVKHLKEDILGTISDDYDEIQTIRKVYIELNKRTNYDVNGVLGDEITQKNILEKVMNFDNLTDSNVVCKGWSELYAEVLIDAGIDSNRVRIVKDKNASHWWVEVDMGNSIIRADATDGFLGSTDLANCKFGDKTNGFLILNKSYSGYRINSKLLIDHPDVLKQSNDYFRKIDESINYVRGDYFSENVSKLQNIFSNETSPYDDIIKHIDVQKANIESFMLTDVPENMNGYDAFAYYRKFSETLFGHRNEVAIPHLKKISINNKYYSAVEILIYDGKQEYILTFDEINGKRIYTYDEYFRGPFNNYESF